MALTEHIGMENTMSRIFSTMQGWTKRQPSWIGVGHAVENGQRLTDALSMAGADYEVDLAKVRSTDVARLLERVALAERLPIPADPRWADKLVKYHGLNIRDQLNQLPSRLLGCVAGLVAA